MSLPAAPPAPRLIDAFGDELERARQALGLSLRDAAERLGIKHPSLAQLEAGQANPTLDRIDRIAEALGLEVRITLTPRPSTGRLNRSARP